VWVLEMASGLNWSCSLGTTASNDQRLNKIEGEYLDAKKRLQTEFGYRSGQEFSRGVDHAVDSRTAGRGNRKARVALSIQISFRVF
jgi:hypothetical protein